MSMYASFALTNYASFAKNLPMPKQNYEVPKNVDDVRRLVLRAMAETASGDMKCSRAKAIGELGRVAIKLFKEQVADDPAKGMSEMSESELRDMAAKLMGLSAE
jgi:hypothetical protein